MRENAPIADEAERHGGLPITPLGDIVVETLEAPNGDTVEVNAKIAREDIDARRNVLEAFKECVG